ncbi:MAG TPA: M28 family peptidase [Longimicrobiales bacterium]
MQPRAGQLRGEALATLPERAEVAGALSALARPRLTGSPGAAEVEAELRRRLTGLGYEIRELPFGFSVWPGRWGVPAAGVLLVAAAASAGALIGSGRPARAGLLLAGAAAVAALAGRLARRAVAGLPWGRVETANWLVHRPGARPRFLVMAHRDSKSQALPTLGRMAAGALALLSWLLLFTLACLAALDPGSGSSLTTAVTALGVSAGLLLLLFRSDNASPGALDNASGLAALLTIARAERGRDDVAFLITDGEELGLAGAEAAAPHTPPLEAIINIDGLDDEGPFRIAESYGLRRARALAPRLAAALLEAAGELDVPITRGAVPAGMLVDHIPFARAGQPAVTLMRGTFRSLLRVHRPHDSPSRLSGEGVVLGARLVSAALGRLRAATPGRA